MFSDDYPSLLSPEPQFHETNKRHAANAKSIQISSRIINNRSDYLPCEPSPVIRVSGDYHRIPDPPANQVNVSTVMAPIVNMKLSVWRSMSDRALLQVTHTHSVASVSEAPGPIVGTLSLTVQRHIMLRSIHPKNQLVKCP